MLIKELQGFLASITYPTPQPVAKTEIFHFLQNRFVKIVLAVLALGVSAPFP
jgi:hypothetical protein